MTNMISVLRARATRGSALSSGELSLILSDLIKVIEQLEVRLEAHESELTALAGRCDCRTKGSSKTPKVRSDKEQ